MEQLVENKMCFICQNNLPPFEEISKIKAREKVCFQFTRLASRFLTADILKTTNICCDQCLPDLETFCEMFESFELLQLELLHLLDKISTKITHSSRTTYNHENSNSSNFCFVVQEKRKRRHPRVHLEKLNDERVRSLFKKLADLDLTRIKHEPLIEEGDADLSLGILSPNSPAEIDESSENETTSATYDSYPLLKDDSDDGTPNLTKEPNDIEISVTGAVLNGGSQTFRDKQKTGFHKVETIVSTTGLLQIKVDGKRQYHCLFCTYVNKDTTHLEKHLRQNHIFERPFICRVENCDKEYSTHDRLNRHVRKTHEKHKWDDKCETCGKLFPYKYELMAHLMARHEGLQPYKRPYNYKSKTNNNKCAACGKIFVFVHARRDHENEKHPKGSLVHCDKCPKTYRALSQLKFHKRYTHGENIGGEGRFPCDICGKAFLTKPRLKDHKRKTHNKSGKQKCNWPGCAKSYYSKSYLKLHISRKHTR